jgi:hypothetical protein
VIRWDAKLALLIAGVASLLFGALHHRPDAPMPVIWAWERPENLQFAAGRAEVAILAGTVTLHGADVSGRPRLQPARTAPDQPLISVVHIEIDRRIPLAWTPALQAKAVETVLTLARNVPAPVVQLDCEVRASERDILMGIVRSVRQALPSGIRLSMTALASWCDTENWIEAAPVDEIVPMLFRMGPDGEALKRRLAEGGDFRIRRCRTAIGVATDTPTYGLPPNRRLYIFSPQAWTEQDFNTILSRTRQR